MYTFLGDEFMNTLVGFLGFVKGLCLSVGEGEGGNNKKGVEEWDGMETKAILFTSAVLIL